MSNDNIKKEWVKPEIIAIVRCQPEESVLACCKANSFACGNESGPTSSINCS